MAESKKVTVVAVVKVQDEVVDQRDYPDGIVSSRIIEFKDMDDDTLEILFEQSPELVFEKRPDWIAKHHPESIH